MTSPSAILLKYLAPGQVLANRYRLERPIGSGAYGAIFLATDEVTGEPVAVKALPPSSETTSKTAIGRFAREMKIIQNIVHPHIIVLYDFGETKDRVPFMVLEYIEGDTLERLAARKPFDLDDGLIVLSQLVSALGEAHACGVIHRDLKPANVMIEGADTGRLSVKVLDFGMAKILSKLGGETDAPLTRDGMAVGTPRYIAPEQARGKLVGPYTDLYAVGLLCYELFTGERAVKDNTVEGAVKAHVSSRPLELPMIEDVPKAVRPIMLKLLAKKVAARYQSAEEVARDLAKVIEARRHGGVDRLAEVRKLLERQLVESVELKDLPPRVLPQLPPSARRSWGLAVGVAPGASHHPLCRARAGARGAALWLLLRHRDRASGPHGPAHSAGACARAAGRGAWVGGLAVEP